LLSVAEHGALPKDYRSSHQCFYCSFYFKHRILDGNFGFALVPLALATPGQFTLLVSHRPASCSRDDNGIGLRFGLK
jgi:hypothetical protein